MSLLHSVLVDTLSSRPSPFLVEQAPPPSHRASRLWTSAREGRIVRDVSEGSDAMRDVYATRRAAG